MTIDPAPAKLAFGATFSAAFRTVFGSFGKFLKLAAVPFLLSSIILLIDFTPRAMGMVGSLPLDLGGWAVALLELAIAIAGVLPLAFLGIMTTRLSLGGYQSGVLPSPLLGRRTWIYGGYLLLLSLIFILLAVAGIIAGAAMLGSYQSLASVGPATMVLGGITGFSILLYLMLRLSLVLPAVALDEKLGPVGSWRLTRRCGMKLLGVVLLFIPVLVVMGIVGAIAFGDGQVSFGTPELIIPDGTQVRPDGTLVGIDWEAIVLANLPRTLWELAVKFFFFAMVCSALASAYAQLSGWGKPRQEILERFE